MAQYIHYWTVRWYSPYTEPPNNQPRKLIEGVTHPTHPSAGDKMPGCIAMIEEQARQRDNGGWVTAIRSEPVKPPRQMSQQGKEKLRRGKLRKRLEAKYPLFAEEMYKEEIAKKPDYFGTW